MKKQYLELFWVGTPTHPGRWDYMGSPVLKRSVVIGGHKTSVSLEDEFWSGLKEIAAARSMTLSDLVATVERGRESGNLSSTLRLFVLESYRQRAAGRAGEGQNGAGASTAMSQAPR